MRSSSDMSPLPIRGVKSRVLAVALALVVVAVLFAVVADTAYAVVPLLGMTEGWTR